MSDASGPGESPESQPGAGSEGSRPGFVRWFRELPVWAQVLIPAIAGAVLVVAGLFLAGAVSNSRQSMTTVAPTETTTTTTPNQSHVRNAALLLIVAQLAAENATPAETSTTQSPTSTTQTSPSATEPATTQPPSTTTAPTTTAPTTTAPTTTAPTITAPTTTAAPSSTEPSTTLPSTGGLPEGTLATSPAAFASAWNQSVEGTDVPALSEGPAPPQNWTMEMVGGVAAYRSNLGGNVWLVALARSPGGSIAQALLVWEPNVSSAEEPSQNALYRDAFQALMKTVNSSITAAQRLKVTTQLGLRRRNPPFPDITDRSATQPPHEYDLFNLDPANPTEPGPATVISVITSQG